MLTKLTTGRIAFSCSKIRDSTSRSYSIIVVGGLTSLQRSLLNSTEILNLNTQTWQFGPILPRGLYKTQMVEHYKGGVVLIGGANGQNDPQDSLYHLPSVNGKWYLMQKKMSERRTNPVAFLVPASFTNCFG